MRPAEAGDSLPLFSAVRQFDSFGEKT